MRINCRMTEKAEMERLRAKLKSESGASITYGLLLFLVCAVLSSVILIAGSAAAGRIANLAETDQRYYSVTSAAEFVKDSIDGKTVTKVIVHETDDSQSVYWVDRPASSINISDSDIGTGATTDVRKESLSAGLAALDEGSVKTTELNLSVKPNDESEAVESLNATISEEVNSGMASITVYNTPKDSDDKKLFRINLTFRGDIEQNIYNAYPGESIMEESRYIQSTTEYRWSLVGMSTN